MHQSAISTNLIYQKGEKSPLGTQKDFGIKNEMKIRMNSTNLMSNNYDIIAATIHSLVNTGQQQRNQMSHLHKRDEKSCALD